MRPGLDQAHYANVAGINFSTFFHTICREFAFYTEYLICLVGSFKTHKYYITVRAALAASVSFGPMFPTI